MGEAGRRGGRLGHCRVGERVGQGESVGEGCRKVDEVHLHSLRDGRESLSEGLRRYILVVLGEFVGLSQSTCLSLSDFGLE